MAITVSQAILSVEGFDVVFSLNRFKDSLSIMDVEIEIRPESDLAMNAFRSISSFVAIKDLYRFLGYFEEILKHSNSGRRQKLPVYVPLELGFQVQVLEGEMETEEEGYFTIRVMVNLGRNAKHGTHVYAGCEGLVDAARIREFNIALRAVLEAFKNNDTSPSCPC
jgi:hypothetical protein